MCDRIITIDDDAIHAFSHEDYCGWNDCEFDNACRDPEELEYYANDKWLYGWHISELVIYDEPRDLSEYGLARRHRVGVIQKKGTQNEDSKNLKIPHGGRNF